MNPHYISNAVRSVRAYVMHSVRALDGRSREHEVKFASLQEIKELTLIISTTLEYSGG